MSKQTMHTKNTYRAFYISTVVVLFLVMQVVYFSINNSIDDEKLLRKSTFVNVIGLPDLSLSNEVYYIRHRTLSSIFSIYPDDGTLREYSNSSFAISTANITNKTANEK